MNLTTTGLLTIFAAGLFCLPSIEAQTSLTPTPPVEKLSEQLSKKLHGFDAKVGVSRQNREQAYAKLLEAQRSIYRLQSQRTQSGILALGDAARSALVTSLENDPGLAESYVALAEVSILAAHDNDEAVALASLSVELNKDSIGGHKLLARLFTRQSGFRTASVKVDIAAKAVKEWKEVTRLDLRNAEAWAMLSEIYERTGKTTEAVEALRRWMASSTTVDTGWYRLIVGGRPEDLMPEQAPLRLAGALTKDGRTREAVEVLAQLLSDDPDSADAMTTIQEVFDNAKAGTASSALDPIRQIVLNHPESLTLLRFFASLDAKVGNFDEAVTLLQSAIDKTGSKDRPASANLHISIGDIYVTRGSFSEAAAEYERALSMRGLDNAQNLDPDEREFAMAALDKLINAFKRSQRINEAKTAIERARKLLGKDDPFADRELVTLYRETGDRDQAVATVRSVRIKNPDDVTLLRLEAKLLMETGKIEDAVGLIKRRIESGKSELPVERFGGKGTGTPRLDDDFSNYIFISQLYNEAGRGSDAVAAAEQAFQVAGSQDRKQIARLMLATAKQTSRQFDDAESILRDILKQTPGNPIALNNLGYFLVERGQRLTEALDLIQRAIAIDPTNPSYLDSLGWALFKLDRTDEAIAKLEQAAKLDDASATINEHLGDAYRKKGSLYQARNAWQRAIMLSAGPADVARVKEKLKSAK